MGTRWYPAFIIPVVGAVLTVGGCAALKSSQPLLADREYERLLVGPLEADYIGNDKCLSACHDHDQNAAYLRVSVHGQQTAEDTGMPLVNCETCHGPGNLAVANAVAAKKCDIKKLISLKDLPAGARSLLCLKCHSSFSMTAMEHWSASQHAQADVSCSDCHKLHEQSSQKIEGDAINRLCFECHPEVAAQSRYLSRHPLQEGKMTCVSCHDPHGSGNENGLAAADLKSLCGGCHANVTGPFVFEHADVTEDCCSCHVAHGSPFGGLLRYQEPFLCLQCHAGHAESHVAIPHADYKRGMFTRCTNCHSQIHGTDAGADGRRFIR